MLSVELCSWGISVLFAWCEVHRDPSLSLGRNLKKSEEALRRTEKEMEENEKEMKKLTAELTTLEDKATEVMNECKQAEVSPGTTLGSRESRKRN